MVFSQPTRDQVDSFADRAMGGFGLVQTVASASSAHRGSKVQRVYCDLRNKIRDLTLPPGSRLWKHEIAAAYGVSLTPVRQALARLVGEALVDAQPRRGCFVASIDADDIREALIIRAALVVELARRCAQVATDSFILSLRGIVAAQRAAVAAGDLARFYRLDEELHAVLFGAIACPRAAKRYETVRMLVERARRMLQTDERPAVITVAENSRLVDAISSRDAVLTGAATRVHFSARLRADFDIAKGSRVNACQ
jgi:DNA-binding GntR family transcriptional regulator